MNWWPPTSEPSVRGRAIPTRTIYHPTHSLTRGARPHGAGRRHGKSAVPAIPWSSPCSMTTLCTTSARCRGYWAWSGNTAPSVSRPPAGVPCTTTIRSTAPSSPYWKRDSSPDPAEPARAISHRPSDTRPSGRNTMSVSSPQPTYSESFTPPGPMEPTPNDSGK